LQTGSEAKKKINLHPSQELSDPPHPRAYHTTIAYDQWMVVFGGNPNETKGEIYMLHFETLIWTKVVSSGSPDESKIP
jgi:hypothetical protein